MWSLYRHHRIVPSGTISLNEATVGFEGSKRIIIAALLLLARVMRIGGFIYQD